jgi:CubicO group peptidase (beta-lactamase class C family)
MYEYMAGLQNDQAHGGMFRYRSILTNLLGWVLECAGGGRFAELFSSALWSKLGAEQDAEITVDAHGCAVEDGGFSVTLLDLARFGQMHLDEGVIAGRRIVPAKWIRRLTYPDPDLVAAFGQSLAYDGLTTPDAMYHDHWWVLDPRRGVRLALGIFGQLLLVHPPSRTVVVKLSTQPRAADDSLLRLELAGSLAICEALMAGTV